MVAEAAETCQPDALQVEAYLDVEALALREGLANAGETYLEVDPGLTVRDTPAAPGLLAAAAAELLPCAGYMH